MGRSAVFRFDAGAAIGVGHAIRCLALADELGVQGWAVRFCTNPGARALIEKLRPLRWPVHEAADPNTPEALYACAPDGCDVLVVDHYGLDAAFERAARPWAARIVVIDDLADRSHACDALLDSAFGRTRADYARCAPDALALVGPGFALLDARFAAAREAALMRRQAGVALEAVLIALGGAPDPALMRRLALAVGEAVPEARIDLVMGTTPPLADLPAGARVLAANADMAQAMAEADLGIGAGGGSSWERCALGLPALLIEIADNQRIVIRGLAKAGAAVALGEAGELSETALHDAVSALAGDAQARRAVSMRAAQICDGLGARRATLAVEALFDSAPVVTLRPASREDGQIMLEWQSAPGVRQFSNNPDPPQPEAHFAWLERRLADPLAGPFEIVEADGVPAGVVRFDRESEHVSRVSILVAPEAQGRGVAKRALRRAGVLVREREIRAQVMPENAASQRLFAACGYARVAADEFRLPIGGPV